MYFNYLYNQLKYNINFQLLCRFWFTKKNTEMSEISPLARNIAAKKGVRVGPIRNRHIFLGSLMMLKGRHAGAAALAYAKDIL